MGILFSNLLSESIFNFGKWSNWKYANMRICVFSVWPLPEVKNWFWKQIWKEKAKHPQICLSLGGSIPEAQIKQCFLAPSPTKKIILSQKCLDESAKALNHCTAL